MNDVEREMCEELLEQVDLENNLFLQRILLEDVPERSVGLDFEDREKLKDLYEGKIGYGYD